MLIEEKEKSVFSTYVEVIPLFDVAQKYKIGILHVCGGDPVLWCIVNGHNAVFSTYVEVIPHD